MNHPLQADLDRVLECTREEWGNLRSERLFLTGGTGFIGRWLLDTFVDANRRLNLKSEVVVLSRNPQEFRRKAPRSASDPSVRFVEGDVRTYAFPSGSFTHAIHGAAQASQAVNEDRPLEMIDTVVGGTKRTLDFCGQRGVRRLLFLSSGAVYGPQPPSISHLTEEHLGAPDTGDPRAAYAESKRLAEVLCCIAGRAGITQVTLARCFALVGPYLPLDIHYAMGNFLRDALRGGPVVVEGDGTSVRSYLYAADLAIWLWGILFRGTPCRPYNVGSPEPITTGDLAKRVAQAFQPSRDVIVKGKPEAERGVRRYVPSVDRATRELGLRQTYTLEESIRRTIDWYVGSSGKEPQ